MEHLSLGVLAHVDAGKTTLTERLLFEAGAIPRLGNVDDGTTQTDSLPLEQQRGITIKSAVAVFLLRGLTVNLIDTPGHPDFIAEVERALAVLDGAILVVSGTDGVQPQTQLLMRVLERLGIPTLLFVNKLDRPNADFEGTFEEIRRRLTARALRMGVLERPGSTEVTFRAASPADPGFAAEALPLLAEQDDDLLGAYLSGRAPDGEDLWRELARWTKAGAVHPVYGGSARTGAGVTAMMAALGPLLAQPAARDRAPTAQVFKVERLRSGERVAIARVRGGAIRARDRLAVNGGELEAVTAIEVAEVGGWRRRAEVGVGQIARLHGLSARIGDLLGAAGASRPVQHHLASPMLESVVRPRHRSAARALSAALQQLAEQDPLIEVRLDAFGELVVSLFGEVQRGVLASTIADGYGIEVEFDEARPVCVERPAATGSGVERLADLDNPFSATLAMTVEPSRPASGIEVHVRAPTQRLPLHIYKSREKFAAALTALVVEALEVGNYGWRVTDCIVTLTDCEYLVADGPRPPGKADTTARDIRGLAPVVVRQAIRDAGSVVCEPIACLDLELPSESLSPTLTMLGRLGGAVDVPEIAGRLATVRAYVRVARLQEARRRLVDATGGYGVVEVALARYEPVHGTPPVRAAPHRGG